MIEPSNKQVGLTADMAALQSTAQSATELPRFDGQLMNLGGWLRALRQQEHLLPSDLSFFAKSGAQIQSNGKVAVASAQHALLLHHQLLTHCEYSVIKPPSLGDRFVELYRRVRLEQNGLTRGGASLPTTINTDRIPEEFADTYLIRPQTLASLDLKLRDALLSLMERREFFKNKMERARRDSGVHLVETLLNEQALVDFSHSSNAAIIDAKLRLEELRFETLSSTHPSSFTALRDELANLLLELPEAERWSPSAIYDFYMRLLASLGDKSIGFAVRSSLTQQQMNHYDRTRAWRTRSCADSLSFLWKRSTGRTLTNGTVDAPLPPQLFSRLTQTIPRSTRTLPRTRDHPVRCAVKRAIPKISASTTCSLRAPTPKAISRAPIGTPLYHKHNPSSQLPSPRNSNRHKPAKPSSASAARALAASCSRPTEHEV